MLDLILVVLLVAVFYRGYRRGFIREIANLGLLVIGAIVAFRSAGASETFFASWTGASPLVARTLGGFTVFFLIQLVGTLLVRRFVRLLGPVRAVDRVAGGLVAGAWFVFGTVMFLLVASAIPLGQTLQRWLDESWAVEVVAGDDSAVKEAVSSVVGDRVLESLVNLNQLIGDRQVVIEGVESLDIPVLAGALFASDGDAMAVFDLLNLARVDAGVDPLAWSSSLAEVAAAHGYEMYETGYFSHVSPSSGVVADRVAAIGIPFGIVGENLALSPTAQSVHDGLLASPAHRENMLEARFTRVGISAVEGPLGLMVVQVFTG